MTELLVFLALWIFLSACASLLWRAGRRALNGMLRPLRAAARANILRLIALLPLLSSLSITAGLFAFPGLLISPHCHPLQCSAHTPLFEPAGWLRLWIPIAATPIVLAISAMIAATLRIERRWRQLSDSGDRFRTLSSSTPIACAVGFLRPTIYLSRGLLDRLPATAIAAITAHERAHIRRRDNLWLTVVRIGALFWMQRETLFNDIELAHDQACDRAAADNIGDALIVADTLVQCARLQLTPQPASNFLSGHIAARVQAILDERAQPVAPVRTLLLLGLLVMGIAAAVPELHAVLENVRLP